MWTPRAWDWEMRLLSLCAERQSRCRLRDLGEDFYLRTGTTVRGRKQLDSVAVGFLFCPVEVRRHHEVVDR